MEVYDFPEIYQILIYLIPYVGIRALLTLPIFNCMGGGEMVVSDFPEIYQTF